MDLRDLSSAVVVVLLVGLVLGIGIYVMSEVRTEVATEYTGTDNLVNITATIPTNTTTLSDASKDDYKLSSVDSVINESGDAIPSTNYSSTDAGVITWSKDLAAGNDYYKSSSTVNITSTYIYDATDSPEEGINDSLEALGDFSGWIAVIVVVIAAAVVMGIVLRSFGEEARA